MAEEEEILYLPKSIKAFRITCLIIPMVALFFAVLALANFTTGKYGLLVLVWSAVIIGVPIGGSRLLKKWKVSAKWNRVIIVLLAIVCSVGMAIGIFVSVSEDANLIFRRDEDMLIQLSDLREVEEDQLRSSSRRSDSLFLFREEGYQSERLEEGVDLSERSSMEYTILRVKMPFIYDYCKEELMAEKYRYVDLAWADQSGYRKVDMPAWEAIEVYRYYYDDGDTENEYFVCYEDCMIQIDFGWEITDADIEKVRESIYNVK